MPQLPLGGAENACMGGPAASAAIRTSVQQLSRASLLEADASREGILRTAQEQMYL